MARCPRRPHERRVRTTAATEVNPGWERNSEGGRSQSGWHGSNLTEGGEAKQAGSPSFAFRKPGIRDLTEAGLGLAVSRDHGA
jgi:hypothetical protein